MSYNTYRRTTRPITLGGVTIGGDAPIAVQSMTNVDTHDTEALWQQVSALEAAGCDVVRLAVPDVEAARAFSYLKERGVRVPLVADVHFSHAIAIAAASWNPAPGRW